MKKYPLLILCLLSFGCAANLQKTAAPITGVLTSTTTSNGEIGMRVPGDFWVDGYLYVGDTLHADGTGSPEGVLTAPIGSTFYRTDGSTGTTYYIKESGTGNTGWVANGAGSVDTSGTLNANEVAVMYDSNTIISLTESEFKPLFNMEAGVDYATKAQGDLADTALQAEVDGSTTNEINTATGDNAGTTSGLAITFAGSGTVATSVTGDVVTITGTEVFTESAFTTKIGEAFDTEAEWNTIFSTTLPAAYLSSSGTDNIKESHLDFGLGADQIGLLDFPGDAAYGPTINTNGTLSTLTGTAGYLFQFNGAAAAPTAVNSISIDTVNVSAASKVQVASGQIDHDDMAGTADIDTTGDNTGQILVVSKTAATYTLGTDAGKEVRGSYTVNADNDALALTLPALSVGDWGCLENGDGVSAALTLGNTSQYFKLDGVKAASGEALVSSGAAEDSICWVCLQTDIIKISSYIGTWNEETPP